MFEDNSSYLLTLSGPSTPENSRPFGELFHLGGVRYRHNGLGVLLLENPGSAVAWHEQMNVPITASLSGFSSALLGSVSLGENDFVYGSYFGWIFIGASDGWIHSERFGWMKFEAAGQDLFLWVPRMNSWMAVNGDGSFTSFQWGQLTPQGLDRYQSSIFGGLTTGDFGGWVASDRFGWMWANGDGTWFWSEDRQEWLGVTVEGGIWSTEEKRFL